MSVQLAWLQEQALTRTGFFCTIGPSCTMCVHSVSSSSIHATPVHKSTLQAQLLRQLPETPIVSWQLTGKLRNRWRGAPRPVLLPHPGPKYMLVEVTTLPPTPPKDHRSLHSPGPKSTAFCWSYFWEPHKTINLQHQTAPHLPAPPQHLTLPGIRRRGTANSLPWADTPGGASRPQRPTTGSHSERHQLC